MSTLLMILIFVAIGFVLWMLNTEEDAAVKRCSRCGVRAVEEVYRGPVGGPTHYRCERCGAEFKRGSDGTLQPLV